MRTPFLFVCGCLAAAGQAHAQVHQEWVALYSGPDSYYGEARAMALDSTSNVYVTGFIAFATGGTACATVKYDSDGNELWVRLYGGPPNANGGGDAIAVDEEGNAYVTGSVERASALYDYTMIKYDPSGNELWVARYQGVGRGDNYPTAIALDGAGDVYVTGWSGETSGRSVVATVKYDNDGNQLWASRYDPNSFSGARPKIVVTADGQAYVTATASREIGPGTDSATVKYGPDGALQWVARYHGPSSQYDIATAIALDTSANVYVASQNEEGCATIRYDLDGNVIWVAPESPCSALTAIAVDSEGNIAVTGRGTRSSFDSSYLTAQYDSAGARRWVSIREDFSDQNLALAVAVDSLGNVYVTGTSFSFGYLTIKYDMTGNEIWAAGYDAGYHAYEHTAVAISINSGSDVFVTGRSFGPRTNQYATIKYSQE